MVKTNHSIALEWNPIQQYKGANYSHNVESHKHNVKKEAKNKGMQALTKVYI